MDSRPRLSEGRATTAPTILGRDHELNFGEGIVPAHEVWAVFVTGIQGVGASALLRSFALQPHRTEGNISTSPGARSNQRSPSS